MNSSKKTHGLNHRSSFQTAHRADKMNSILLKNKFKKISISQWVPTKIQKNIIKHITNKKRRTLLNNEEEKI